MTLRFSQADGLLLREVNDPERILLPRLITADGRYVLSSEVLNDPAHAHLSDVLKRGEEASVAAADLKNLGTRLMHMGQPYEFYLDAKPWSITSPALDVLRFEVRNGDIGWSGDAANNNNRAEVSAINRMATNATVWEAWAFLLEAGPSIPYGHCMVGQWHGSDLPGSPRSPVLQFELGGDQFRITTRQSASTTAQGALTVHLTEALPERDTWVQYVRKTVFGANGSLQVWRDGSEILNVTDFPIGYYNDATGPYYKFGIYRNRHANSIAVRYANVEWGTTDLTDRITNPLSVPN